MGNPKSKLSIANYKTMSRGTEVRICQNCKKDFTIEPEDFTFYEKIKVPPKSKEIVCCEQCYQQEVS